MKTTIAGWAVICLTAFGVGYALPVQTATPAQLQELIGEPYSETAPTHDESDHADDPAEDDTDFDCRLHGNHECGVEDPNTGKWVVVGFDSAGHPLYWYPHPTKG